MSLSFQGAVGTPDVADRDQLGGWMHRGLVQLTGSPRSAAVLIWYGVRCPGCVPGDSPCRGLSSCGPALPCSMIPGPLPPSCQRSIIYLDPIIGYGRTDSSSDSHFLAYFREIFTSLYGLETYGAPFSREFRCFSWLNRPYNRVRNGGRTMMKAKRCGRRYPWEQWFRARRFTLKRGLEYDCRTSSMVQAVYQAAARMGRDVSIEVAEDEIQFTVEVR